MLWIIELISVNSIAHTIFILSLIGAIGLLIGSVKLGGIKVGVAGVLFSGIILGNFNITIEPEILEFVRETGLIIFVYMVGLQIGPGFFSSLRKNGLILNSLAFAIVFLGLLVAVSLHFFLGLDAIVAAGLLSGATTNTPSLGSIQTTLSGINTIPEELKSLPGIAYAISYPFGIIGIIKRELKEDTRAKRGHALFRW